MITRIFARSVRSKLPLSISVRHTFHRQCIKHTNATPIQTIRPTSQLLTQTSSFHSTTYRNARGQTADALMEHLTDLYATAKDEFEIAAEETIKKTVYAQEDRDAAREALTLLKEALEKAVRESDPDVAKEVTNRVGPRIRELENAVTNMEESALEDH